jgi:hypothetical protein
MLPSDKAIIHCYVHRAICRQFLALAKETFREDRFNIRSYLGPFDMLDRSKIAMVAMFLRFVSSRYQSRQLNSSLLKIFNERQPISGDATVTGKQRRIRVAVTTANDGEPCIFSNYSRTSFEQEKNADRDHSDGKQRI